MLLLEQLTQRLVDTIVAHFIKGRVKQCVLRHLCVTRSGTLLLCHW